jgi:hypothetical protein
VRPFKFFQKKPTEPNELREFMRNNVPIDVVACGEIGTYLQGVESGISGSGFNPYHDSLRGEIWNRGFWNSTNLLYRR